MAKRLTIEQAALALGTRPVTLYAWIDRKLAPRRTWGQRGLYLYDTDLPAIIKPRRGRPPKQDLLKATTRAPQEYDDDGPSLGMSELD